LHFELVENDHIVRVRERRDAAVAARLPRRVNKELRDGRSLLRVREA
tara:strand:- start:333 stop:473 length:141 start_codon:yes stop_codon:yes gene_type:complete